MSLRFPTPDEPRDTGLPLRGKPVEIILDGTPVRGFAGENVAVALYASGHRVVSRSIKYHRPRAFFCLEGHCGACLMRVGGVPNLRACMEPCRDGLTVTAQNAYPSADIDVLEAVDWLFPGGMNHHTLMTGSRVLNAIANKMVRKLSGLGQLPARAPLVAPLRAPLEPDVAVIGAGPAGLAAAAAAAGKGVATVVVDEHERPGGSLLADPRHGPKAAAKHAHAATSAGAVLISGATALGYYAEDSEPTLAVATCDRLYQIRAKRYIYATGAYAVNQPFVNNDRPGVIAARAAGRMLVGHRVKPGHRVCVAGSDAYAQSLSRALAEAGCEVIAVGAGERVTGVRGRVWVTTVEIIGADGRTRRYECDVVAVSAPPAPASEGPRQHGCAVEFRPQDGGFAVIADSDGRTAAAGVFACGDVCGYAGPAAAWRMGERVGLAAARDLGA